MAFDDQTIVREQYAATAEPPSRRARRFRDFGAEGSDPLEILSADHRKPGSPVVLEVVSEGELADPSTTLLPRGGGSSTFRHYGQ